MSIAEKNNGEQQIDGRTLSHLDAKLIARGLFELEDRLKKDIMGDINQSHQKILAELDMIQQNFGRIFNVLERHDTFLQDVVQKYAQLNTRIDKVMKEQELMRKRVDVVECLASSPTAPVGSGGSPLSNHRHGGRVGGPAYGAIGGGGSNRNPYNNRSAPRHAFGRSRPPPSGAVVDGSMPPFHMAPPPSFQGAPQQQTQQFSSTTKLWTRRGSGEFTSDEDSDDEESDAVVAAVENKVETIISSTTTVTKSETITVAAGALVIDDLTTEKMTLETVTETATQPADDLALESYRLQDSVKMSPNEDPIDEAVTDNGVSSPPLSRSSARGGSSGNLTGGFGAFRRGKPTTTTTNAKTDDQKVKTANESNFDNPLSVRPLTTDELQVLSKAGRKTPPHFFNKPTSLFRDSSHSPSTSVYTNGFNVSTCSPDMGFSSYGRGGGTNFGSNRGKKFARH